MSFNLNSWQIQGDTSTWIFATCIVIASSYLAIRTWVRMKKNRKIAIWEGFRFLIILLIVVTLFNPERVEQLERSQKSQIVCLQDISSSMETKDIILDESGPI